MGGNYASKKLNKKKILFDEYSKVELDFELRFMA